MTLAAAWHCPSNPGPISTFLLLFLYDMVLDSETGSAAAERKRSWVTYWPVLHRKKRKRDWYWPVMWLIARCALSFSVSFIMDGPQGQRRLWLPIQIKYRERGNVHVHIHILTTTTHRREKERLIGGEDDVDVTDVSWNSVTSHLTLGPGVYSFSLTYCSLVQR